MVTSSILSPSDCTPQALADFENLVTEAGTVDPKANTAHSRRFSTVVSKGIKWASRRSGCAETPPVELSE